MSKKWVVLDAMGVIFEVGDDVNTLLIPFLRKKNCITPISEIFKLYFSASLGDITSYELWKELGFKDGYPKIEKEYLDTCFNIDPEFKEIAQNLKKDYKVAYFSNNLKDWSSFLRSKFDLNEIFDVIIISGEVGYRKPDDNIFQILLERTQSLPEDCIFVDDKLKNLRVAAKLGIKTIRFVRKELKVAFCSEFEANSFKELYGIIRNFY